MAGGYIADKFLGNRTCILLGGATMCMGQLLLFFSASIFTSNLGLATNLMWLALFAIILGNGFFKPNISSMVGQLYPAAQKSKLDSAFTIFYMGINVGAFLGQFICPYVGDVRTEVVLADGTYGIYPQYTCFSMGLSGGRHRHVSGSGEFLFFKRPLCGNAEGKAIGGRPAKAVDVITDPDEVQAQFSKTVGVYPGRIAGGVVFPYSIPVVGSFCRCRWLVRESALISQR